MLEKNTIATEESELPELPPQRFTRDSAVGAREINRDRVYAPGCAKPQTRPSGGYMDY